MKGGRFLILLIPVVLGSCVSTSSLFQDGKSLGKGRTSGIASISYNYTSKFETDSVSREVKLKSDAFPSIWAQYQLQFGVHDHVDIGGSFGLGLASLGGQVYSKFSLLSNENKLGISLLGLAGVSTTVEWCDVKATEEITFYNLLVAIPISFDFNEKNSIVLQPIISLDNYDYFSSENKRRYNDRFHNTYYRLGLGYIHTKKNSKKVHYNLGVSYSPLMNMIMPTFGIGFIALEIFGNGDI